MSGPAGARVLTRWRTLAVALLFAGALLWALGRFGGVETWAFYRLFLVLLIPLLLALAGNGPRAALGPDGWLFTLVGVWLLARVALEPTLTADGYLLAAIGWIGLYLGSWLASRGGRATFRLAVLLIVAGVLETLLGLAQSLGGVDAIGTYFRDRGRLATGTFINRNHFAGLVNMSLGLGLGGLAGVFAPGGPRHERLESVARAWILVMSCSSMGLAVLLSRSRGGSATLVVVILFVTVLALVRRRSLKSGAAGVAVGSVLLLTVALGLGVGLDGWQKRFARLPDDIGRLEVFRETLPLIADHPLTGVGPGMYRWRFREVQSYAPNRRFFHAHNDYLEVAAEWGIPVALIFWGFVLFRFGRSARLAAVAVSARRRWIALGCAAAILSISIHGLVDFNLHIPANLLLFSTVLGLAWSEDRSEDESRGGPRRLDAANSRASLAGFLGVALLAVAALAAGWRVWDRHAAATAAAGPVSLQSLERAATLDPTSPDHHFRLGLLHRDALEHFDLATARRELAQAVELNPWSWRYRQELARVLELVGLSAEAESQLGVGLKLNPNDPSYRWRVANFYLRQERTEEALAYLNEALSRDPALLEATLTVLSGAGLGLDRLDLRGLGDPRSRLKLLEFLVESRADGGAAGEPRGEAALAKSFWEELLAATPPLDLERGAFYIRYLLDDGREREARRAWIELAAANGQRDAAFEAGRALVWNGSFEAPIASAGLDWLIQGSDRLAVRRAQGEGVDGGAALKIDLAAAPRPRVTQRVVVEPGQTLELAFSARSEGLGPEDRLYFLVLDDLQRVQLAVTEPIAGAQSWQRRLVTFAVPSGSSRLLVRLGSGRRGERARPPQGRVWIDAVELRPSGGSVETR